MRYKLFWFLISLLLLSIGLTSCAPAASPVPELPTETSPATKPPIDTLPPPTTTPTATPEPPTPTVIPTATQTLAPSATATASPTATFTSTATRQPGAVIPGAYGAKTGVVVYMIAQKTGGKVGCGDSAVPVPVAVPRTKDTADDIEAALDMLFSLKSKYYGNLYNPVSHSTLRVQDVELDELSGSLTVWLSGKYRPTGDDCDNTRVKAQIWSTAKQFGGISSTAFYINGPHPFGDFVSNDK